MRRARRGFSWLATSLAIVAAAALMAWREGFGLGTFFEDLVLAAVVIISVYWAFDRVRSRHRK